MNKVSLLAKSLEQDHPSFVAGPLPLVVVIVVVQRSVGQFVEVLEKVLLVVQVVVFVKVVLKEVGLQEAVQGWSSSMWCSLLAWWFFHWFQDPTSRSIHRFGQRGRCCCLVSRACLHRRCSATNGAP